MRSTLEQQLATYADHLEGLTEPVSETEIVSRTRPVAPRFRRGPIAVAAAAVVLVLVGIAAILAQVTGQEEAPLAPTVSEQAVFSWSEHDLSEWITEEELTAVLKEVVSQYADTDLPGEAVFDHEGADVGGDEGAWRAGGWTLHFHNGNHEGRYPGPPLETDPKLPQGVTFDRESGFGWGHYILSGPRSDEMISLFLQPPGTSFGYPAGSEAKAYEEMVFALASWMLGEMGWLNPPEEAPPSPTVSEEVPPNRMMSTVQVLYGAGDISCPEHWAHDQSLPVGRVEFQPGQRMFTVVVELTAAAADSEYWVEVWEPENCQYNAPLLFDSVAPRALTTDEHGFGQIEFVVEDVEPGLYRLNVNLIHTTWEDAFPNADDTRLWEIGGAGFSLVEIPAEPAASGPEGVFSWGEDIFEWVTADEVKAMFESLSMHYAGVPLSEGELVLELDPSRDPWDGASWSHDPSVPSQTPPWRPPPGQWSISAQMWEWEEFVIAPQTDPRLPDGVVFWPAWGFGYTLRGPNSNEAIGIGLLPPLESDLRPFDTYPNRRGTYDDMYFEVASMMLRELGWAD